MDALSVGFAIAEINAVGTAVISTDSIEAGILKPPKPPKPPWVGVGGSVKGVNDEKEAGLAYEVLKAIGYKLLSSAILLQC